MTSSQVALVLALAMVATALRPAWEPAASTAAAATSKSARAGSKAAEIFAAEHSPPLTPGQADSLVAALEDERRDADAFFRTSPQSPLAAMARADFAPGGGWLLVGSGPGNDLVLPDSSVKPAHLRVRVEGTRFRIEELAPGATFTIAGRETTVVTTPAAWVGVGRYRLRLSYQNAPALIAFDPGHPAQTEFEGLAWWPVDLALRYVLALEPESRADTVTIESTNGPPRPAARVGRFTFHVGRKRQRLSAYRLLEPGVSEDAVSLFFRDGTSGKGSYGMGRYLDAERLPDGRYVLDFNRASNPYCAHSTFFNCPIPRREDRVTSAIMAGEAYREEDHVERERSEARGGNGP